METTNRLHPSNLKIVIVGGGSVSWMPRIGRDLLLTPSLAGAEYVLLDVNQQASDLTKAFLDKLARKLNVNATFVSTGDRPAALAGADYVIITITTGGLAAMARDLAIPEDFGVYHTVGDTSGPGGWARLIRNFDTFVALANDINRYAPGAVVLNYTNPMTMLTDVLARICTGPVIGLCHGLFDDFEFLRAWYGLASEQDVALDYAGLNHFFWVSRARAGKTDAIADLGQKLQVQSFSDLMQSAYAGQPQASQKLEVATELFRLTGVLPYLGDRHICEFFSCYITSRAAIEKYRLVRTTIAERVAGAERLRQELIEMVGGEIGPEYAQRTREAAADIIDAHSQGRVFIDVGNVPNIGQVHNLPRGLVVETAVRVDRNGFTPLAFGDLPPAVKGFIDPYAALFPLTVDACFKRDKRMALQALRLDPVCAHLSGAQVIELGEQLIAAHQPYITAF
jgi:alpha-galactosidase/6-phospho-beta-glucosidase family protein